MFSPQVTDKLIENEICPKKKPQLFDYEDFAGFTHADEAIVKHENKQSAFANFANITCTDEVDSYISNKSTTLGNIYDTHNFQGVGLYKPFGIVSDNPLNKSVYNYSMATAGVVRGIAFSSYNSGYVNNPLSESCHIVDNSYEFNKNPIKNNDFNDIISATFSFNNVSNTRGYEVPKVDYNTYRICDIIKEADMSQILDLGKYKKSTALVKTSWLRSFIGSQIELFNNIKRIFSKEKIR